jgi:5-methylthioadenosine/S-adenosylhomocysteine deaminase
MNPRRTVIKPKYLIAYRDQEHRLLEDGVVVVEDDHIAFIGKTYDGEADQVIEAPSHLVAPGFICTHFHAHVPLIKDFFEDQGQREFYMSAGTLSETIGKQTPEEAAVSARYSVVEALKSGCTTVVDLFLPGPEREVVLNTYGEMGLRAYVISQHYSATWTIEDTARIGYQWVEGDGYGMLKTSEQFIDTFNGSYDDRIRCLLGPAQIDTCSPELLKETRRLANELGVGMQIVGLQSLNEFREIVARYGVTPVEYLNQVGLLGPDLIIGHGIFIAGHSWTTYPEGRDLSLLADTGTSIAHSVNVFARAGIAMESFARYLDSGINVSMGMDICPRDMFQEMRLAIKVSKIVDRNAETAKAIDVYNAATLGGAKALRRTDLGRLEANAKADLIFLNLETIRTAPVWDPLRTLVYSATNEDVDHVMVNGRFVMKDKVVEGVDLEQLARDSQAAQESLLSRVPQQNRQAMTAREVSPWQLKSW